MLVGLPYALCHDTQSQFGCSFLLLLLLGVFGNQIGIPSLQELNTNLLTSRKKNSRLLFLVPVNETNFSLKRGDFHGFALENVLHPALCISVVPRLQGQFE